MTQVLFEQICKTLRRVLPAARGKMSIADNTSSAPIVDAEEAARARRDKINRIAKWTLPSLVMALSLWPGTSTSRSTTSPITSCPAPFWWANRIIEDWGILWPAMLTTSRLTILALIFAVIGGVALAVAFTQSKWAEMSFFPYAVILQVTPVVAIAPLLQIYVESAFVAALLCAWIVAFFPILSNTTIGLKSADHNLQDLFTIYGATRWQRLRYLSAPSACRSFWAVSRSPAASPSSAPWSPNSSSAVRAPASASPPRFSKPPTGSTSAGSTRPSSSSRPWAWLSSRSPRSSRTSCFGSGTKVP